MKTEKEAVGGESAAETKQKEKTGCQENDSRTATNTHSKLQTPLTNSKNTRKKDLELNTAINILLWSSKMKRYVQILSVDAHFLLTADSVLVRKNYRTVSVLSSAAVFFLVWDSRTFKGSEGDLRSPAKYWILYVYYSAYYFIILFLMRWKRGKIYKKQGSDGSFSFYMQPSQSPYCALHNKINFY